MKTSRSIKFKFVGFVALVALFFGWTTKHPFYASIYEIEVNRDSKRVEIASKIFFDDLERTLKVKYGVNCYLNGSNEIGETDSLLSDYFSKTIMLSQNNEQIAIEFVGKEYQNDVCWIYFQSEPIKLKNNALNLSVSALMDVFETQSNIVHHRINSRIESHLLTQDAYSCTIHF